MSQKTFLTQWVWFHGHRMHIQQNKQVPWGVMKVLPELFFLSPLTHFCNSIKKVKYCINLILRNVLKLWNSAMEEGKCTRCTLLSAPQACWVLNSSKCRDLRTYLTFPLALTNHQQPLSQCKSYYRFLPLHDWQCTVHCVCLLSKSLASRGT